MLLLLLTLLLLLLPLLLLTLLLLHVCPELRAELGRRGLIRIARRRRWPALATALPLAAAAWRCLLPSLLRNYSPSHVLLELGGNDGLRGLPLSLMRENLTAMIEMSQDAGATVLIAGMQIPPNYGPRYTQPFFDQYAELAEQYGLYLIPFLIDGIPQQPELMQADGIHPKAEAQVMILDNVWPILLDALN